MFDTYDQRWLLPHLPVFRYHSFLFSLQDQCLTNDTSFYTNACTVLPQLIGMILIKLLESISILLFALNQSEDLVHSNVEINFD